MIVLEQGRYRVTEAGPERGLASSLELRARSFPSDAEGGDAFDPLFRHLLVGDVRTGAVVASCRLRRSASGAQIGAGYAAQHYDLSRLARFRGRMLELGRFCVDPDHRDPDILRIAFAALTRIVERDGIRLLFGCVSFAGSDPAPHAEVFAHLGAHHRAPDRWRPGRVRGGSIPLSDPHDGPSDPRRALAAMPPLMRSYLRMGVWVGDHAVPDPAMGTLHVFTAMEVRAIPAARRRLLRAAASRATCVDLGMRDP